MFGGLCINCSTEGRSGSANSVDDAINENVEPESMSAPSICTPLSLTAARTCGASRPADSTAWTLLDERLDCCGLYVSGKGLANVPVSGGAAYQLFETACTARDVHEAAEIVVAACAG